MKQSKHFLQILLLVLANFLSCISCFGVHFRTNYDAKIQPYNSKLFKREETQFFNKASYSFNGLQKFSSIPVLFPTDICILHLDGLQYATALHNNKNGVRHFSVFKSNNGTYSLLADIPTPIASSMDCVAIDGKGYVAITFNITSTTAIDGANEGSPIFEIAGDRLRAFQFFDQPNLAAMFMHVTGTEMFLLQSFKNTKETPNLYCPYFIWSESLFHKLGQIPCSNARHLEPFSIDNENYLAIANYADQRGRTSVFSEIYKYAPEKEKFQLLQRIRTNGAVDVKYFSVPLNENKENHFLVFGNSLSAKNNLKPNAEETKNLEADSVFYVFDKGQFVAYQRLSLYAVEKFLPVQNTDSEKFILLVACANQDIKIYNLNDWKFEESDAQLTEGALGKGITNMRFFQENGNSFLVIANELMIENETNIFLPIFKQDEHANQLRQQIIDWTQVNIERLKGLDLAKLKQNVEMRLSKKQQSISSIITDIYDYNVKTVVTKSLVHLKRHFSNNYWKALSYANLALDALQTQFLSRKTRELHPNSGPMNEILDVYEQANVDTLIVRDKMEVQHVNGIDLQTPIFDNISARKANITGRYSRSIEINEDRKRQQTIKKDTAVPTVDVMNFVNLETHRLLNNYTWNDLVNNTIKRRADNQVLKSKVKLSYLQAENLFVSDRKLNDRNLSKLITINDGNYIVEQDLQFSTTVTAKILQITERLNNIRVLQQKFDVLMKDSNETQVVTGAKSFDSVRILEPVTIAGHMFGKHLQSITPNKAIYESFVLNGNYTVKGNIMILNTLSGTDIIDVKTKISSTDALSSSISVNTTLNDVNMIFEQPFAANSSHVSFINEQSMQQLVRANVEAVQVIEAEKRFKNSLEIRNGFGEVKTLNGVDVEKLRNRLLLRNTKQRIKQPMHFGEIVAKSAHVPLLHLNSKNISDFLTKSGNQHIQGSLKVENISTKSLKLQDLNTSGKILHEMLSEIYRQKAVSAPSMRIFHENSKFHGSLYVKNFKFNSTINGRKVQDVERQLTQLDGNIKYVGNFVFNYKMNISNLTFFDSFNGIPAKNFAQCWLQKSGDQIFTEPQTFFGVESKNGTQLRGNLNSIKTADIFDNSFWINRNEHVQQAIFQNPIQMQGALLTSSVNGLRIPDDIFYRSANLRQVLNVNAFAHEDISVQGKIYKTTHVNGFDLVEFDRHLNGFSSQTLYMDNVKFAFYPFYKTLNKNDVRSLLNVVWFSNENIDLRNNVEIFEAHFTGLLEFEGPINNLNMQFLKENYFSRSLPQEIGSDIIFLNNIQFENQFSTVEFRLFGPMKSCRGGSEFNFDEFSQQSLKTNNLNVISAPWSIHRAIVHGDLLNTLVNNLNLVNDVLRMDATINTITAKKRIQTAVIKKLCATLRTTVNDVNVDHWVRDAVYVYENYTIRGVTTLDSLNVYNDLLVRGKVNSIAAFDDKNLMLRDNDQIMRNDIFIQNEFVTEQRILTTNFENLQGDFVNGFNLAPLANQARLNTAVQGQLIFTEPLKVQQYRFNDVFSDSNAKRDTSFEVNNMTFWDNRIAYATTVRDLKTSVKEP